MKSYYYLWEQEALDLTDQPVTLRFGEIGYNHPSADGYYDGRISQAALFQRSIGSGDVGGSSELSYGVLVLLNGDGALDGLLDLAIDGRPFRLLLVEDGAAIDTARLALSGVAAQMVPAGQDFDEIHVYLRDPGVLFDTSLQTRLLGGTNVGGTGLDGDAGQEGDPHPIAYGPLFNVEPVCVNAELDIYELNDTAIGGDIIAKDGGAPYTLGVARTAAEIADPTNIPTAGHVDYCLGAEGQPAYIRLGSRPVKTLTVDFKGTVRNGVFVESAADILRDIALHRVGLAADAVSATDLAALDTLAPAAVALWIDSDQTAADALDEAAVSAGAWWGFDRLSMLRVWPMAVPVEAEAVLSIRDTGLGVTTTADDAALLSGAGAGAVDSVGWGPIPAHTVKVFYDPNPTEQDAGDLVGADDPAHPELPDPVGGATVRARLAKDWRSVVWPEEDAVSAAIRARHPLSDLIEVETSVRDRAGAVALAARLGPLHTVPWFTLTLAVALDVEVIERLDLGVVVMLDVGRFGRRPMRITSLKPDLRGGTADVGLLGVRQA